MNPPRAFTEAAPDEAAFRNEPRLDFSLDADRRAFAEALGEVRQSLPLEAPLLIDDHEVRPGDRLEILSPNDLGLRVGWSALAGPEEAERAIASARRAAEPWGRTSAAERAGLLRRTAAACRRRRLALAALEVYEAGKPWREADADVCEAIDFLNYYAAEAERLEPPAPLQPWLPGERNELRYLPLGVVGVVGPWNFPMAIPVGMMAAAVAAGNAVILKPAEQTPLIAWQLMELLRRSGLPAGVVNFLPGRGEIAGRALVQSPEVNMIAFTGSKSVGLEIIAECARVGPGQRFLKRVVAEMGGKNAIIVDASADLDAALPEILSSAYGFSGQKCSACSRLIVVADVYADLARRLAEGVASLRVAPAWEPGCQVGPLIDAEARQRVEGYLTRAEAEGRRIARVEPGELARQGHFAPAAAYAIENPGHPLAQEEIFGPLLTVLAARDFDEALRIANGTDYALTGGVFSRTPSHLALARQRFVCGNLYLNRGITGAIVGRQPFGGWRLSGVGSKAGGPDYLKQFLIARTETENLTRQGFAPEAST